MVENKSKKTLYFIIFILPCLALYLLFFIWPFIRGIGISFTNWDGLTPKTPITMEKTEFEENILNRLKKQSDKDYLLKIYSYDSTENAYKRLSVGGHTRSKLEHIVKKAGYEPSKNKFVGLNNYKQIFTGKADKNFYPHHYQQIKYNKTSDLPLTISKKDFEKQILKLSDKKDITLFTTAYKYNKESNLYKLQKEYDDFEITDPLWQLNEFIITKTISANTIDSFIREIKIDSLDHSLDDLQLKAETFIKENNVNQEEIPVIQNVVFNLTKSAELKNKLSTTWILNKFSLGVIGFTLFFAFFSVIGINVIAFALALALDQGIYGQKIMRTIFFLPNVLSMVIVALIWSIMFNQLLPAITGIKQWIGDPAKTPWLLVLVAIWQGSGYYMLVYLAGLQNIPTDIIEAAKIDGANATQRFFNITIPNLIPAITISLFLSIANALKSFDMMYAMVGPTGYSLGTVPLVYDIYFQAYSLKETGMATAKAMILFIAIFLVTGTQLFAMKKKEIEN